MKKVLFVCLGNICRSPAAEGIFQKLVHEEGLSDRIQIDSAGTSAYHEGEAADGRMIQFAKSRGYDLTSRSRPFVAPDDFLKFDYILPMDPQNLQDLYDLDPDQQFQSKILPMTEFCTIHRTHLVPDPYYKGDEGFELVLDILEDACRGLLKRVKEEMGSV